MPTGLDSLNEEITRGLHINRGYRVAQRARPAWRRRHVQVGNKYSNRRFVYWVCWAFSFLLSPLMPFCCCVCDVQTWFSGFFFTCKFFCWWCVFKFIFFLFSFWVIFGFLFRFFCLLLIEVPKANWCADLFFYLFFCSGMFFRFFLGCSLMFWLIFDLFTIWCVVMVNLVDLIFVMLFFLSSNYLLEDW